MSVYYLICAERIEVKLLKSSQKRIFCFPQRFYRHYRGPSTCAIDRLTTSITRSRVWIKPGARRHLWRSQERFSQSTRTFSALWCTIHLLSAYKSSRTNCGPSFAEVREKCVRREREREKRRKVRGKREQFLAIPESEFPWIHSDGEWRIKRP